MDIGPVACFLVREYMAAFRVAAALFILITVRVLCFSGDGDDLLFGNDAFKAADSVGSCADFLLMEM